MPYKYLIKHIRRAVCSITGRGGGGGGGILRKPMFCIKALIAYFTLFSLFESDDHLVTSPHLPPGSNELLLSLFGSYPLSIASG